MRRPCGFDGRMLDYRLAGSNLRNWPLVHELPTKLPTKQRPAGHPAGRWMSGVEATSGFEPLNRGFADLRVKPLHHVAASATGARPGDLAAPRGFEPRFTDPKSAVLPLDEGAAGPSGGRSGAEDGTRTRDPHLGKVMLYQLSHFRSDVDHLERWCREPDSNWRHRDFQSRALPTELSRPDGQPGLAARRRSAGYHGPSRVCHREAGAATTGPVPYSNPASAAASALPRGGSLVSSRRRLIRSRMAGWVDMRFDDRSSNFLIGLLKYMCCVPRLATSRTS